MRSKLENLTPKDIEAITRKANKMKNVPLVVSKSTGVIMDKDLDEKIHVLSDAYGMTTAKFIQMLLKEDIDRLWKVYQIAGR